MSEKINVMLTTENLEQLQMGAMIASVGAVSGSDVSVFLSMNALKHYWFEGYTNFAKHTVSPFTLYNLTIQIYLQIDDNNMAKKIYIYFGI